MLNTTTTGEIRNDSVVIKMPKGTPLTALKPSVSYRGASLSPQSGVANNFSATTVYTVTAEDGTQKKYKVVTTYLSNEKEIASFVLKAALNPGLTEDITGRISGDTITLGVTPGVSLASLVPTIIYKGQELVAASGMPQNFTLPLSYEVRAEDRTSRRYVVMCGQNATVYVGSSIGRLYALDALTGQQKWMFQATVGVPRGTRSLSTAVYYGGRVYVGCEDGILYVLDAETGKLQWFFNTGSNPIYAAPAVKDGIVYVSGWADYGSILPGYIYALDAATGQEKWRYQISFPTAPVVGSGVVCSGSGGYGIFAIDAATGQLKWNFRSGITLTRPGYANGVFYGGGEGYELFALDAATGNFLWKHQGMGGTSAPVVSGGKLYAAIGGRLDCYDAATGESKWQFSSFGAAVGNSGSFSSPVSAGGMIFAGCSDSYFYAVDASNGTLKWKLGSAVQAGGVPAGNVTVSNGVVFVGRPQNTFYALDAATGAVIWKFTAEGAINAGACVVDLKGRIAYSGDAGNHE